jgi:hypothetical protein
MALSAVASEYIRAHRGTCSDGEIRKALGEQGFSEEDIADAFHAAGDPPARPPAWLRAIPPLLYAFSALLVIAALCLVFGKLPK